MEAMNYNNSSKLILTVLVLLLVVVKWESVSGSEWECREEERSALLQIHAALVPFPIYSWDNKWEGNECCRWKRVACDPTTGHITELDLSIDPNYEWDRGTSILLNATMFLPLRQLRSLSLSGQGIYDCMDGAELETWSNLTELEILDLSNNYFQGRILYDLGSVSSLRTLSLSDNFLEAINGLETWSNLTKLENLDLSWNNLDRGIINDLSNVPLLRTLNLCGSYINGSLLINGHETLSNLTKLEILDFSSNYLGRGIINDLTSVPSLRTLKLSDMNFGNLPINGIETLSNLTRLEILDLSYNNLDGSIIYDLAKVSSLRTLNLSYKDIDSNLPINGLETLSNLTKLEILNLTCNDLNGSIIYDLDTISSFRTLILSYNHINDSLPINGFESLSNLTKLEMLDLSQNDLQRSIFSSLAKVSSLRALYLDFNSIGGNVPVKELSVLNLEVLSISNCMFSGSFPYLGQWSSLKALSLAENDLNGSLTSKGLCRLKNLEELDLSHNNFTGNIPLCMGDISSLKLVDLSYNQFQVKFPSIFERLLSLRYLSLSNNLLEGTMSIRSYLNHSNLEVLWLSTSASNFQVEVVNLPFQLQILALANCIINVEPTFLRSQHKLQMLDLSNTGSKGPSSVVWFLLENNPNLRQLDLRKNFFTGPLELPFLNHEHLSILDISDNLLDGELPADMTTKLPFLYYLNLSKNYFHGPLPLISGIRTLDLSSNNLTDDIQNNFSSILPSVVSFMDLSNNKFYGSFSNSMNFTLYPMTLLLNDNNISGEIPFSICNTSFEVLDISNNELNGVLPDCIGRATQLEALKLSGNHLEGSLPLEMCFVQNLWLLDLSDNKLSGSIPPCSNQSTLEIVYLGQNNLTGNFPITWLNISNIYAIDIQENHLSGELLIWIAKESNLRTLQARENLFEGPIPEQICEFKYLRILDFSHNNLSGQIPSCIIDMGSADRDFSSLVVTLSYGIVGTMLNFKVAKYLLDDTSYVIVDNFESMNFFGLELMSKGRFDFYWEKTLLIQCLIDLSSNKLVGKIPGDIGQMNWLITLNLSNNHLSGAIPNSISNLNQLESLDLSHNYLTGEIPRELTKLTSLESFSVAYNNLSGPTLGVEAQFSTFVNSSYEGNPNLCGPPLSKSCIPTIDKMQPSPNEMSDDPRYEDTDFLILFSSFSLFFVVSFWGFMVVLYFKRNWRYALFTLVDWYGDVIYGKVVLLWRKIGVARTRRAN